MTGKIFRSILTVVGVVLLACVLIIMGYLYDYFAGVQTSQLWQELSLAVSGVETSGMEYLTTLSGEKSRLTWIAVDGSVLYDAQADEERMENHSDREEVWEALETGKGQSERYSMTLLEKTVYCAQRLSDGSVLRISVSTASVGSLVLGMLYPICLVMIGSFILAFLIAHRLSRKIVEPLNQLDMEHPLENQTYDELAPLLNRIHQQNHKIDEQLRELQKKKEEFTQITDNMNEGLVLLDHHSMIVSINPAAKMLFQADEQAIGQDFLTIERSRVLENAMKQAMAEGHSEVFIERRAREYQIDISRIESDESALGLALLAFDITEKNQAERTRREFTANVSHELKTPLTAILGSSEMLESGLVKSEDIPRFVGHIHKEAARLLTLIEDILRLSQLDEGVQLPMETVNLASVAEDVVSQLSDRAEAAKVTVTCTAEPCFVQGVSRLVSEIFFNLVENAIKYNTVGGNVSVSVTPNAIFTVTDTGIGIPLEHQQRVFERFYRVDKSHSKQIGGTGLGLSIVKHAAAYLGAQIDLKSEVGKGTTVQIVFPKQGE